MIGHFTVKFSYSHYDRKFKGNARNCLKRKVSKQKKKKKSEFGGIKKIDLLYLLEMLSWTESVNLINGAVTNSNSDDTVFQLIIAMLQHSLHIDGIHFETQKDKLKFQRVPS